MRNIIYKANVIDPSEELIPSIRIAPFSSKYLYRQIASYDQIKKCVTYLKNRFGIYSIQSKARTCIEIILEFYKLNKDDVVTIFTTSGNAYISSCVTSAIEKVCRWSREITPESRLIFINHEFGYPYQDWDDALSYNLPIVEDCAYTFLTVDDRIGKYSDFVIYSLPKVFPMQQGAIIKLNVDYVFEEDKNVSKYVLNVLSQEINNIPKIVDKRLSNFYFYRNRLSGIGIKPFFSSCANSVIPGTFLFSWSEDIDYPKLKDYMQANGVECSCFYGKSAFFVPVHHNLTRKEINFICDLLEYYFHNMK